MVTTETVIVDTDGNVLRRVRERKKLVSKSVGLRQRDGSRTRASSRTRSKSRTRSSATKGISNKSKLKKDKDTRTPQVKNERTESPAVRESAEEAVAVETKGKKSKKKEAKEKKHVDVRKGRKAVVRAAKPRHDKKNKNKNKTKNGATPPLPPTFPPKDETVAVEPEPEPEPEPVADFPKQMTFSPVSSEEEEEEDELEVEEEEPTEAPKQEDDDEVKPEPFSTETKAAQEASNEESIASKILKNADAAIYSLGELVSFGGEYTYNKARESKQCGTDENDFIMNTRDKVAAAGDYLTSTVRDKACGQGENYRSVSTPAACLSTPSGDTEGILLDGSIADDSGDGSDDDSEFGELPDSDSEDNALLVKSLESISTVNAGNNSGSNDNEKWN